MQEFAQAPCALIQDTHVRVYFSCRPIPDSSGQYVSYSAWVDLDRQDLTRVVAVADRPFLDLGQRGAFDEFGTYPVSVVAYEGETRAYYGGWTRCSSVPFDVAIGMAIGDATGTHFQRVGPGPILAASTDEPFVLSGPKIRRFGDEWILFYIAGKRWILDRGRPEPVYRIRAARSSDGRTWEKLGRDLIPARLGDEEAQASPDVSYRDGKFHMYFCYRHGTDYRNGSRGYRIGYAVSADLINWSRDDSRAGIGVSSDGWDSEMVSYPHVFELDSRWHMLYLGNQVGRHGFGLATLESERRVQS